MSHPATRAFFERLIALHYKVRNPDNHYFPTSEVFISRNEVSICVCCTQSNADIDWSVCCWSLHANINHEVLPSDVPLENWEICGPGFEHSDDRCKSWELYFAQVLPWTTVGRLMPPAETAHLTEGYIISPHAPSGQLCLICLSGYTDGYGMLPRNTICCNRADCNRIVMNFVYFAFRFLILQEICPVSDVNSVIAADLVQLCLQGSHRPFCGPQTETQMW